MADPVVKVLLGLLTDSGVVFEGFVGDCQSLVLPPNLLRPSLQRNSPVAAFLTTKTYDDSHQNFNRRLFSP